MGWFCLHRKLCLKKLPSKSLMSWMVIAFPEMVKHWQALLYVVVSIGLEELTLPVLWSGISWKSCNLQSMHKHASRYCLGCQCCLFLDVLMPAKGCANTLRNEIRLWAFAIWVQYWCRTVNDSNVLTAWGALKGEQLLLDLQFQCCILQTSGPKRQQLAAFLTYSLATSIPAVWGLLVGRHWAKQSEALALTYLTRCVAIRQQINTFAMSICCMT